MTFLDFADRHATGLGFLILILAIITGGTLIAKYYSK
jgi:hypothetical protein